MTVLNPDADIKFKDLWRVIPSLIGFPPLLFWLIEIVLLILFVWWFF